MTRHHHEILKLVAIFVFIAPMAASAQDVELSALAWLAGCWAAEGRDAGSGEQWTPLAAGTMLGVGRTVRNGETVDHEFLQIRRNAEGKIVYIALPSGQTETSFVLTSADENSFTFENPEHDFPQRIIYRARADGGLLVRIEGTRDGALRSVDFPMQRVACDAR
jgi:Domain of unknown function (DUF6265)